MQVIRLPADNMGYIQIIQIRSISAPKDLDREVGIDNLSKVRNPSTTCEKHPTQIIRTRSLFPKTREQF